MIKIANYQTIFLFLDIASSSALEFKKAIEVLLIGNLSVC
jgi:hypothetical protein